MDAVAKMRRQGKGMQWWWMLAGLCCLPAFAASPAWQLDRSQTTYALAQHADYLVDETAKLTEIDVQTPAIAAGFRPLGNRSVNLGVTSSALWLRLQVDVPREAAGRWLLVFDYAPLDRVEVFAGTQRLLGGDHLPKSQQLFDHRMHVLPLELSEGQGQWIYARLQSTGNLNSTARLITPSALHQQDQRDYVIYGLCFGMLLALAAYNFLLYLVLRERAYLSYVAYSLGMIVGQVSQFGFGSQLLWPEAVFWGDKAPLVGFGCMCMFAAMFSRDFLQTALRLPALDRLLKAVQIVFGLAALAAFVFSYALSLRVISVMSPVFGILAMVAAWQVRRQGQPGGDYFLLAWTILLIGGAMMALRNIGVLPSNGLTENAFIIASVVEMLLLSFALAHRIQVERRAREYAQQEVIAIKQTSIQDLELAKRDLEIAVVERTQALAAANLELEWRAHYDSLTGLANRSLLRDRLEQAVCRAEREQRGFSLLLIDLDGFKQINDTWGHATGDRVLVHVAQQLQSNLRASDTVARLGGDEFVALLQSATDQPAALAVGEKLCEAVRQPLTIDAGQTIRIECSIGVALWDEHGYTADALLAAADRAMYRAKDSEIVMLMAG